MHIGHPPLLEHGKNVIFRSMWSHCGVPLIVDFVFRPIYRFVMVPILFVYLLLEWGGVFLDWVILDKVGSFWIKLNIFVLEANKESLDSGRQL